MLNSSFCERDERATHAIDSPTRLLFTNIAHLVVDEKHSPPRLLPT